MNIHLLQLIGKILSVFVFSIASNLGFTTQVINVNNYDKTKSLEVVNTVIKYDTIIKYSSKIPINVERTVVEGEDGIIYQDKIGNTVKTLKEKVDKVIEVGTGKYGEYKGVLTLYGPDCETCDGKGIVYCPIDKYKYHNLIEDGIYYNDKEYGEVRILSAALQEFPCGTIIEINNSDMTKVLGIVLDTGSGMRNAYNNGFILIDLAHKTEKDLPSHGTNRNTNFSVKRWGF